MVLAFLMRFKQICNHPAQWTASGDYAPEDSGKFVCQGTVEERIDAMLVDKSELACFCHDWAEMCKHVAAVMYGVGARLDQKPDLLFLLRGVDHSDLMGEAAAKAIVGKTRKTGRRRLAESSVQDVFGIDAAASAAPVRSRRKPQTAKRGKGLARKR